MDIGKLGMRKHHIKAVLEADVTQSRSKIRKYRSAAGCSLSFNSWIVKCIAAAASEFPEVHACLKKQKELVIFDDVDISIMVEKLVDGQAVPIPMVLRKVNEKTVAQIDQEIEDARNTEINDEGDFVLGEQDSSKSSVRLFSMLPQRLRLVIWRIMLSDPFRVKSMMGTVIVSSVGMMGRIRGWFIPYSIHSLCIAVGSIVEKASVKKGEIKPAEFLELTILLDHDVVDGAPAARFASRLVDIIEKGENIPEV